MKISTKIAKSFKIFFITILLTYLLAMPNATKVFATQEELEDTDFHDKSYNKERITTQNYNPENDSDYEDLLRQIKAMHGEIELLQHKQDKIEKKLDKLEMHMKDMNLRFAKVDSMLKINIKNTSSSQIAKDENHSPEVKYREAYTNLRRASNQTNSDSEESIQKAEEQFQNFVAEYPQHKLTSNAYYWLGQIASEKKDYPKAIEYYMLGYKSNPITNRAQDNLIKMAEILIITKQNDAACTTLNKLQNEFKDIKNTIKTQIADMRKNELHCSTTKEKEIEKIKRKKQQATKK